MSEGKFTCEVCGGEFRKGWTDEEAKAERLELFGNLDNPADDGLVCDDCHKKILYLIGFQN